MLRTDSPALLDLGDVRRNSLRSLRELRSNKAPQVRSTKRASRADPEAALLGAADTAARAGPDAVGPQPACAGPVRKLRCPVREHHDASGKGAGRQPRARLCAAEKRSRAGPRAKRASYF
ncbi:MAG TPA: hypothetical protein VK052_06945 [Zeimonas sp.]|nr:hypothetical protein [Zeimonas sp.]